MRTPAVALVSSATLTFVIGCARGPTLGDPALIPGDASTRVLVSMREMRVIFPGDTATRWGWSDRRESSYYARYTWRVLIDGMAGERTLVFSTGRTDDGPAEYMSLHRLLERGRSLMCFNSAKAFGCGSGHTRASAVNGRVVLSMRDTATIRSLFALRPRFVRTAFARPGEPEPYGGDSVAVEYVAPEIPVPSAATLAEAERLRREASTPDRWTYRTLTGADRPLRLAVGDSADLGIGETRCVADVCMSSDFEQRTAWTVGDTTIAGLRTVSSDSLRIERMPRSPDIEPVLVIRSPATSGVVTARRPGRTTLRVSLPVPAYEGPPNPGWSTAGTLERTIIVVRPTNRSKTP